jgi:hypothetical protein
MHRRYMTGNNFKTHGLNNSMVEVNSDFKCESDRFASTGGRNMKNHETGSLISPTKSLF